MAMARHLQRVWTGAKSVRTALSPCLGEPRLFNSIERQWEAHISRALARATSALSLSSNMNTAHACLEFTRFTESVFILEGRLEGLDSDGAVEMYALTDSGRRIDAECRYASASESTCGTAESPGGAVVSWRLTLPYESSTIKLSIAVGEAVDCALIAGRFSRLRCIPAAYVVEGEYLISNPSAGRILVTPATKSRIDAYEKEFATWLQAHGHAPQWMLEMRREEIVRRMDSAAGRVPREILLCDRPMEAGDNAEALFSHIAAYAADTWAPSFALASTSADYERIAAIGTVVDFGSHEHMRRHLRADILASSHASQSIINPFGRYEASFADLNRAQFVFLQHGVTKDDVSPWLNRRNTNIRLFITASEREKKSIVANRAYGFDEPMVALTGFPRHDQLLAKKAAGQHKRLLIAPTWRANLVFPPLTRAKKMIPNPCFSKSDFYLFYQKLLHDSRLAQAARAGGWDVRFVLHPSFRQELGKFSSSYASVLPEAKYYEEIATAAVFVTDYSSLAFDAALCDIPVVYIHEDREAFYRGHSFMAPGYFSYENDGFGPVCATYEDAVDQILQYMAHPEVEAEYAQRKRDFFMWPQSNAHPWPRCEAVLRAIDQL